jgi:hypothetical protein
VSAAALPVRARIAGLTALSLVVSLRSQEKSLRRVDRPGPATVIVPVVGSTDLSAEDVGAVRMGELGSADPRQPGVSIWVSRSADGGVSDEVAGGHFCAVRAGR